MNEELIKYHITPRVLKADCKQTITIKGLDRSAQFFDDVAYYVKITAVDDWNFSKGLDFHLLNNVESFECRSINGVISFEYYFNGEQEWIINIFRKETEKHGNPMHAKYKGFWNNHIEAPLHGISFSVYSLNEDLYNKTPYKGDLHIHTSYTDGYESPEMVAAWYRRAGFDFISITEHHIMDAALDAIQKFKNINTDFKIFPGEEVHNDYAGYFHIVNFNAKNSVNEIILNNREQVEKEIDEIVQSIELFEDYYDKREIAWRKWIYNEIHKAGGIAILPHPYSVVDGAYHVRTKMCKAIFDLGLCDVLEISSGVDNKNNKNQVALYHELRALGYNIPIVGSSDSHTALKHGESNFDCVWTIAFSEDTERIPGNILNGLTTVVDNASVNQKNVYGSMRLVKYTWFLIENYFTIHDALCLPIGQALLRFIFGDDSQNLLIELLENELKKFKKIFFGR